MRFARTAATILAIALTTACTSGAPPTVAAAVDRAQLYVASASESAWQAVEADAPYRLSVRYNPAPCECPDFEVHYLGSWHRVVLSGSTATIQALRDALANARPATVQTNVLGAPTASVQRTQPHGQLFTVFEIESIL